MGLQNKVVHLSKPQVRQFL